LLACNIWLFITHKVSKHYHELSLIKALGLN